MLTAVARAAGGVLATTLAAVALPAPPAAAQTPAPPAPGDTVPGPAAPDTLPRDSVLARLQRAEEAIALLRQQLAAQAASATQTGSRSRFDLSGRVLLNGFSNSRRVNNVDVPQFVRPDTVAGVQNGALGGALRQTTLTGTAFVPRVLGAAFTGDVSVDFYGGQQPSPGGRHFPLVRLRTARGVLRWRDAEVMAGQDVPLVAAIEPVSVAAVGVAEFGTAGNLWIWLPQVRLTFEKAVAGRGPRGGNGAAATGVTGGGAGGDGTVSSGAATASALDADGGLRLGVQAAVLAPNNGDNLGTFDTFADAGERARRPFLQARVRARWGEEDRAGEVGLGVHRGWIADPTGPPRSPLVASTAAVVNALVPLGGAGPVRFDVRGEAFQGQALRGLGGGGIAQTFGVAGANTPAAGTTPAVQRASQALRTRGGWVQANARYLELLTVGAGCGVDAPRGPYTAAVVVRRRNNVCEGHAIVRPEGPLLVGLTYRRTRTGYAAGPLVNDHVNLAVGYQF
jgi:hypothetical protein